MEHMKWYRENFQAFFPDASNVLLRSDSVAGNEEERNAEDEEQWDDER